MLFLSCFLILSISELRWSLSGALYFLKKAIWATPECTFLHFWNTVLNLLILELFFINRFNDFNYSFTAAHSVLTFCCAALVRPAWLLLLGFCEGTVSAQESALICVQCSHFLPETSLLGSVSTFFWAYLYQISLIFGRSKSMHYSISVMRGRSSTKRKTAFSKGEQVGM